jgi:ABC-2 type transport system ATP-binding protein
LITVESVSKSYHKPVLVKASHEFASGAVTFLMGANGGGKTTLFKCMLGLESYSGTVLFDGLPLQEVRDSVVPVFDDAPFYPHLSGKRNLELLLGRSLSALDVREAWTLGGDVDPSLLVKPVRGYSSGQRKRLAVSLALLSEARYLVMDEVASGLDLPTMDAVVATIKKLTPRATVVVSGHQFDFYSRIVDHVVALRGGALETVEISDRSAGSLESTYRKIFLPDAD